MNSSLGIRLRTEWEIKSDQDAVLVGQIADNASAREREFSDEGRCGEDFIFFGLFRLFQNVDDEHLVRAPKIYFANAPEIRNRPLGSRSVSGNI